MTKLRDKADKFNLKMMYAKAWLVEQLDSFKNKKMHKFNLNPENLFRCPR